MLPVCREIVGLVKPVFSSGKVPVVFRLRAVVVSAPRPSPPLPSCMIYTYNSRDKAADMYAWQTKCAMVPKDRVQYMQIHGMIYPQKRKEEHINCRKSGCCRRKNRSSSSLQPRCVVAGPFQSRATNEYPPSSLMTTSRPRWAFLGGAGCGRG